MDTHGERSHSIGIEVATAAAEAAGEPKAPEAAALAAAATAAAAAAATRTAAIVERVDGRSICEYGFSTG